MYIKTTADNGAVSYVDPESGTKYHVTEEGRKNWAVRVHTTRDKLGQGQILQGGYRTKEDADGALAEFAEANLSAAWLQPPYIEEEEGFDTETSPKEITSKKGGSK